MNSSELKKELDDIKNIQKQHTDLLHQLDSRVGQMHDTITQLSTEVKKNIPNEADPNSVRMPKNLDN